MLAQPTKGLRQQMELFVSMYRNRCAIQPWPCGCVAPPALMFWCFDSLRAHRLPVNPKTQSGTVALLLRVLALQLCLTGCAVDIASLPKSSFNRPVSDRSELEQGTEQLLSSYASAEPAIDVDRHAEMIARSDVAGVEQLLHGSGSQTQQQFLRSSDRVDSNKAAPRDKTADSFTIEAIDAPLGALLFSLASDAKLQLQVNGQIDARVTINALHQPFENVMRLLADQGGFSWQERHGTLSVWSGDAYARSYAIDYLNIHRRTQSSVGLATQVGTINAAVTDGGSIANSSQTQVENTSEHHFWDSLHSDLQSMVNQGTDSQSGAGSDFSINREAGLLSLYARPEVHRNLQHYLELLHGSTQRQVLIEATVVEVALSDSFEAGVDWQVLANGVSGFNAAQVLVGAPQVAAETVNRIASPAGLASLIHQGSDASISATLSLLEQFGDVRILSKPRIIALNNQSSVLKVVDNRVYFTVNVQRRQTEDQDEIVTETEIHTVPVGLVMHVTPYISERGSVMLNVRPTLSRILGFVNDPNPELAAANVSNGVPEIQVREMESMLQVDSGQVAIIGGLMQETQSDNDARLPGLGRLPGIGRLFSKRSHERRQTELLIVLRPTVLDSTSSVAHR